MTAPYNLDGDWALLDGFEAVTLYRRQPGGGFDSGTQIPHGVAITSELAATGDPRLAERRLAWLLCPAECSPNGELPPKQDDVIATLPGSLYPGRWTVDRTRSYPLGSTHRCECIREV